MTRTRISLLGLLLLAFLLRVLNLNGRAMWYDEAFAVLYAEKTFAQMWYGTVTLVQGAAADVHPLFFYALLHGWMQWVGETPLAVRFFSAALSVGTVAVVYRLTGVLFSSPFPLESKSEHPGASRAGNRIGLLAALIVTVSPFAIAYGQEARMYALLGFSSALLILAYVMLEQGGGRGWWAVLVISGAAMLYSHNLAAFFGVTLALWILIRAIRTKNWRSLTRYAVAGIAILVLWLPWLTLLPSQLGKIQQAYWIGTPDGLTVLQTLLTFTVDFDNARLPPLLLPFALIGALLVVLLLVLEFVRGGWRDARVGLVALLFALPPVLIFVVSLWRPVYLTRALMPSFVMLTILVAWLLTRMPKVFAWGLGGALAVLTLASLVFYYPYADFPRPPFAEAEQFLSAQLRSGDVVVHDNKESYFPMYYYARANPLPQHFVADPKGAGSDTLAFPTQEALGLFAEPLDHAVGTNTRVWFVMFQEAREESAQAGNLDWMRSQFHLQQEWTFHDLELYLFEK